MKKRKVTVTTGTRADYGLLRPLLYKIKKSHKLNLYLIVTGMHLSKKHGLTIREIKNDGFKVHAIIDMIPKGDSPYFMAHALGEGILGFSTVLNKIHPDLNIILGDRDEMLASALAASHLNIPNVHIHGGDISGGIDEYNRHAITKLSNIHFAATRKSRERIIRMGENPELVFFTGSPGVDEIRENKITSKEELEKKYRLKLTGEEIILIQHPVTTQSNESGKQIQNTLQALIRFKKTIIAIMPNSDAGSKKIFKQLEFFAKKYDFIHMYPTLPRSDYLGMLKNCGVLVGNSSSGLIEASYFNIPVVNIGDRQKNREKGKRVVDTNGNDTRSIYAAIKKAMCSIRLKKNYDTLIYGDGTSSSKMLHYLESIPINSKLIEKQISY